MEMGLSFESADLFEGIRLIHEKAHFSPSIHKKSQV